MKPTIVIGIGKAGCRMSKQLAEFAEAEGTRDEFEFITIDTNTNDLYQFQPDGANPQELGRTDDFWDEDVQSYGYLNDRFDFHGEDGTVRQRAVSRYYLDERNNFPEVYEYLDTKINKFANRKGVEDPRVSDINIWLVNSLGGGTGSGAFPMLAAMLQDITDGSDLDVFVGGLGSLPRLDNYGPERMATPDANRDYYANAYAALRELRELINFDDNPDRYPIEFEIGANLGSQMSADSLTVEENPFDVYWLLGFDEEQGDRSYIRRMNSIAAACIYYVSGLDSAENWPDANIFDEQDLYAIDATQVESPIADLQTFVDLDNDIQELAAEIENLEQTIDSLHEDTGYLDELLYDLEFTFPDVPDETETVSRSFIRDVRNRVQDFDPQQEINPAQEDSVDLESRIEALFETSQQNVHDGAFEKLPVVEYVYSSYVHDVLTSVEAEHRFKEYVNTIWRDNEDAFSDELLAYKDEPPVDQWVNGLEEELVDIRDGIDQQIEEIMFGPIKKRRLKERRETLDNRLTKLRNAFAEYSVLTDLVEEADIRRDDAREALIDAKQNIEREIEQKTRALEDSEKNKQNKKELRDRKRANLAQGETLAGYSTPPVRDAGAVTQEMLGRLDNLADCVDNNIIERQSLAQELYNQLRRLNEGNPVEDEANTRTDTLSVLAVMTAVANVDSDSPAGNFLQMEVEQGMDIPDIASEFDYHRQDEIVELNDGHVIWLLGLYTGLAFENMSEFYHLYDLHTDEERNVGKILGGNYPDEKVTQRFAYPELFPNDPQIRAAFGRSD